MPDRRWVHRLVEQFPLIDKERGKRSSGRYSGSQDPLRGVEGSASVYRVVRG
jgi:hypothetical protein